MSLLKTIFKWLLITVVMVGITMLLFGEAITPTKIIALFLEIFGAS